MFKDKSLGSICAARVSMASGASDLDGKRRIISLLFPKLLYLKKNRPCAQNTALLAEDC